MQIPQAGRAGTAQCDFNNTKHKGSRGVKAGRDQKHTSRLKEQSKPDKRKKQNLQFVNQAKSKHHKKEVKLKHRGTPGQWHKRHTTN